MPDTKKPLISVIIAVYNPGKYLRPCLDSIVGQTYKNLEIILVDDGSTDDSLAVCKEYAERDSRIIVYHKENSGVSATRNRGIRLAHGDYFSFIDSDDWLEKDTYEYLMKLIAKHNVDAVNHEHFVTYPDKEITNSIPDELYGLCDRAQAIKMITYHFPFAWNKLYSKKLIENTFFNEEICRGEDTLFALHAFDKADKVWFDNRPLYHYVQSEQSAVRGRFRRSQLTAIKLIKEYDFFYSSKYPELYNKQLSSMMNLMITLHTDMCDDKEKLTDEKRMVINEFKKMYKTVNMKELPKKQRYIFRLFRFSPSLLYAFKKAKYR